MPLSVSIMWIHFHKYIIYDYIYLHPHILHIYQFLRPYSFLSDPNMEGSTLLIHRDATPTGPWVTAILKHSKTNHTMPWNWEQAEIQHQHLKLYRIRGRSQNLLTLVTLAYSASTLSFTLLTNHSLLCSSLSRRFLTLFGRLNSVECSRR